MKELGLKAYLPQHAFRVERRKKELDREAAKLHPRYDAKVKEYEGMLSKPKSPETSQLIERRISRYIKEDRELGLKREAVQEEFTSVVDKLYKAHTFERDLRKLGNREVSLERDVRGKEQSLPRPVDEKAFQKQLQQVKRELQRELRQDRSRGLGL